jgi:hypothetical protein
MRRGPKDSAGALIEREDGVGGDAVFVRGQPGLTTSRPT